MNPFTEYLTDMTGFKSFFDSLHRIEHASIAVRSDDYQKPFHDVIQFISRRSVMSVTPITIRDTIILSFPLSLISKISLATSSEAMNDSR